MNKRTISSLILGSAIALAASSAHAATNTITDLIQTWTPQDNLVHALIGGNSDFTLVSSSWTGAHPLYSSGVTLDGRVTMSTGAPLGHTTSVRYTQTLPVYGQDSYGIYQGYYPQGYFDNRGANAALAEIAEVPTFRTYDQNVLTFTFTVAPGVIAIETSFIFATDETYKKDIVPNGIWADVFAFWVDGENYALLPNGEVVTARTAMDYFVDGSDYGYLSRTEEIKITALLNPNLTEHTITIAIADVHNGENYSLNAWLQTQNAAWYDSGIFLGPITAVPEPETWAMLLAGLGLVGVTAKRRNRK